MRDGVPRIMRGALVMVDARSSVGELYCVCLSQQDHSGCRKLPYDGAILLRYVMGEQVSPGGRRDPLDVKDVLCSVGDAVEYPCVRSSPKCDLRGMSFCQCAVPRDCNE